MKGKFMKELVVISGKGGTGKTSIVVSFAGLAKIADGHFLPFKDSAFDVTVALTTFGFVRDTELVIQEMVHCDNGERVISEL